MFACAPFGFGGGGGAIVPSWSGDATRIVIQPATATATLSVNSDGSISGTNYSGASAWYAPPVGSPGAAYWVKATPYLNTAPTSGSATGSTLALTSNRSWTWTVTGAAKIGTFTIQIYSDSGGTNLVATGTVSVYVESTP